MSAAGERRGGGWRRFGWAGLGRAGEREKLGRNRPNGLGGVFFELFQIKQFVKCCFKY
jgi:hypothetical protein